VLGLFRAFYHDRHALQLRRNLANRRREQACNVRAQFRKGLDCHGVQLISGQADASAQLRVEQKTMNIIMLRRDNRESA
jgi:hypothetical protein